MRRASSVPPSPQTFLDQVRAALATFVPLRASEPVVVGVSGGADSLALAWALDQLGYPLVVAHFDHGLRPESAAQAQAVAAWAREQGWPVIVRRGDVAQARRGGESLEAVAREQRYRFLFDVAQAQRAQAVAVAHTQDDQAETVLLNLLRGAGLEGLQGMAWVQQPTRWHPQLPLVRPLLAIPRAWTQHVARVLGLPVQEDPSNADLRYRRNWVRHRLLPLLAEVNPQIRATLARTAQALAADASVLADAVEHAWRAVRVGEGYVRIPADAWARWTEPWRARILRRAWAHLLGPAAPPPSWDQVQAALRALEQPMVWPRPWARGLFLLHRPDGRFILLGPQPPVTEVWPQVGAEAEQPVPLDGVVALPGGWRLQVRAPLPADLARAALADPSAREPWSAWLDVDAAPGPWVLRGARPGERFWPVNTPGPRNLYDLLAASGVHATARRGWPVLVDARGNLIWLAGRGPAHPVRVREQTQRVAHIRLIPPSEGADA
ncbi:MAG: tRNA lysidine(34) synthetase TilS [Chloroflexi bacterium]|nr:tRNA lysidine(34) synthetase TilS [Chloroflexota bacterium]